MEIDYKQTGEKVLITIRGDINTEGGHRLSVKLQEIMALDNVLHVTFDMTEVNTITSSGIGKLLNFYKYIDMKNGSMQIEGISKNLFTLFKEIHLDRIFPIKEPS